MRLKDRIARSKRREREKKVMDFDMNKGVIGEIDRFFYLFFKIKMLDIIWILQIRFLDAETESETGKIVINDTSSSFFFFIYFCSRWSTSRLLENLRSKLSIIVK